MSTIDGNIVVKYSVVVFLYARNFAIFQLWPPFYVQPDIYICTVQRRLSAHYAHIYAHFSLFDVFTVALQVTCGISMKFVV